MTRLEENPKSALAEAAHVLPNDIEVRVVRNHDNLRYLNIPRAPVEGEITESDLLSAQSRTTFICVATATIVTTAIGSAAGSASIAITT